MPWEYIYAQSDEGLCPGLVPHAYKMSKMFKMLELHSRVALIRNGMENFAYVFYSLRI